MLQETVAVYFSVGMGGYVGSEPRPESTQTVPSYALPLMSLLNPSLCHTFGKESKNIVDKLKPFSHIDFTSNKKHLLIRSERMARISGVNLCSTRTRCISTGREVIH